VPSLAALPRSRPAAKPAPNPAPNPERETVLVVDDSRAQRHLLASLLRKWGHDVITCADARDALQHAQDPNVGLIIRDWMMPGMTGPEFCRHLRRSRREGYAYVILLTSKTESGALAEGLDAGADDFLTKPVRAPELRARLNAGARIVAMHREVTEKNHLLSAALDELKHLYTALDQDLEEARRLQQSLLQDRYRSCGNVAVSLWLRASGHVGGDMVGSFPVSEQVIGVFSIDVSGHGVASAIIAARLAGLLSAASPDQNIALERQADGTHMPLPPDEVARRLNHMILEEIQSDRYFTMCLAFLNRETGEMQLVQAGHPHPLLLRADGEVERVGQGGLPIGLLAEADFVETRLRLRPGDRMLLYSDGLTECPDANGAQLDEQGLTRLILANAASRGADFLPGLERDLMAHSSLECLPDDASALWLEFAGP